MFPVDYFSLYNRPMATLPFGKVVGIEWPATHIGNGHSGILLVMQTQIVKDQKDLFGWMAAIVPDRSTAVPIARAVLGIFPGEGVGPEVIAAAIQVLDAVESVSQRCAPPDGAAVKLA